MYSTLTNTLMIALAQDSEEKLSSVSLLSQFRVVTAPFHRVGFADFWLADQLNSLGVVLMDLEYMICFYSFELDWKKHDGLISSKGRTEQSKTGKILIQ